MRIMLLLLLLTGCGTTQDIQVKRTTVQLKSIEEQFRYPFKNVYVVTWWNLDDRITYLEFIEDLDLIKRDSTMTVLRPR